MSGERAAIYLRVSTAEQEDNYSLQSQEAECLKYAEQHGWAVVGIWREVHSARYLDERPQLRALLESIRSGGVDVLLVHSSNRLSREQMQFATIAYRCKQAGTRLDSVTENFEAGAVGEFMRSALAFAAEIDWERRRENTMRGMRARAEAGLPLAASRPLYGYEWRDGEVNGKLKAKVRLAPDPVTAPVVRRIFAELAEGGTLRRIAAGLTRDGIPIPSGAVKPWSATTIRHIVKHPSYKGEARAFALEVYTKTVRGRDERGREQDRVVKHHRPRPDLQHIRLPQGTVPPLVDPAMWQAAGDRLSRNRSLQPERPRRNGDVALLHGGLVRCGNCASRYALHVTWRDGRASYRCQQCNAASYSASDLDRVVWDRVSTILTDPQNLLREVECRRERDTSGEEIAAIDRSIADVERRQQRMARNVALLDDEDAAAPLLVHLRTLAGQLRALQEERARIEDQRGRSERDQARLLRLVQRLQRVAINLHRFDHAAKRDALLAVGAEVLVYRSMERGEDGKLRRSTGPRYRINVNLVEGAADPTADPGLCRTASDSSGGR